MQKKHSKPSHKPIAKSAKTHTKTTHKAATANNKPSNHHPKASNAVHKEFNSTNHNGLYELFIEELHDLHSAEKQLIEALPRLAKEASSTDLKHAIRDHLKETQMQAKRLEHIFKLLGEKPSPFYCQGVDALLKEGEEFIGRQDKNTRDVAIISAAQKIEHYEIAAYGTARAHAKLLNFSEIAELLDASLDEEAAADSKLTKLAMGTIFTTGINKHALNEVMAFA